MQRYEMICVGAGPAGLAAAVEAAKNGVQVIVYDENELPGGQLFKQINCLTKHSDQIKSCPE